MQYKKLYTKDKISRVQIRMPHERKQLIKKVATKNKVSVSSLIIAELYRLFKENGLREDIVVTTLAADK